MSNPYQHFYTQHFNSLEFQASKSTTPMLKKLNSSTKIHFLPISDFKLCLCELDMYQSIPWSFYRTMTWKRIKYLQRRGKGMSKGLLLRNLLCVTKEWYFLTFVLYCLFHLILLGLLFPTQIINNAAFQSKRQFFRIFRSCVIK